MTAGKAAFVGNSAATGDDELLRLARLIGPMAREDLGDSSSAGAIWLGASKRIAAGAAKAECLTEAADVAISDLATPEAARAAKGYLDAATAQLGAAAARPGPVASRLKRVWGDYYALTGDGRAARKAYTDAAALVQSRRTNAERTAWAGAHGRSTEQFIKTGELDRAAAQIRQWQDEFPADRITGYVTLLYARYWAARQKYPQAIALAGQLAAVNADSPYVDQITMLAADCHLAMGSPERAIQTLQSLLKNQPGSPMVPQIKKRLAELQKEIAAGTNRNTRRLAAALVRRSPRDPIMQFNRFFIASSCVLAFLLAVEPSAASAAKVTVDIQGGQAVTFVGAIHRWDQDGNLLKKVDPKAKIDAPEVDYTAAKDTAAKGGAAKECRRQGRRCPMGLQGPAAGPVRPGDPRRPAGPRRGLRVCPGAGVRSVLPRRRNRRSRDPGPHRRRHQKVAAIREPGRAAGDGRGQGGAFARPRAFDAHPRPADELRKRDARSRHDAV